MKKTRRLLAFIIAIILLWQVIQMSLIPIQSPIIFIFSGLIILAFILISYSIKGFILSRAGSIQDLKWGQKIQILSVEKEGEWYYYTIKKKDGSIRLMKDKYFYHPDEQFYVYTWNGKLTLRGRINNLPMYKSQY